MLVMREDRNVQVDYWQPALRIVLKPGDNYEAFIKGHTTLTRRFVNLEHAQVAVDVADIGRKPGALGNDPRVTSVDFMPVPTPLRPK